jgi:hypothetical protein
MAEISNNKDKRQQKVTVNNEIVTLSGKAAGRRSSGCGPGWRVAIAEAVYLKSVFLR